MNGMTGQEKRVERAAAKDFEAFVEGLRGAVQEILYPEIVAAITPGRTMELMKLDEAETAFEAVEEDEIVVVISELGLMASVSERHLVHIEGHSYLAGDTRGVAYAFDEDGEITGLGAADLYALQMHLKENTFVLGSDRPDRKCIAVRLD